MTKKIAVQMFGHLRTFEHTYKSFFENLINPNKEDGYEIDIFIHTWDKLEANATYHNLNIDLSNKTISDLDKLKISQIYLPKKILIEEQIYQHGASISLDKVSKLREEYEKENNIKYDYIIYTRPDIFFIKPLKINKYISLYKNDPELKNLDLPNKHIFCGNNMFTRMNVADPRYVNECDLIWFCKFSSKYPVLEKDSLLIPINYKLYFDFIIYRANTDISNIITTPPQRKSVFIKKLRQFIACFVPSTKLRRKIRGQK